VLLPFLEPRWTDGKSLGADDGKEDPDGKIEAAAKGAADTGAIVGGSTGGEVAVMVIPIFRLRWRLIPDKSRDSFLEPLAPFRRHSAEAARRAAMRRVRKYMVSCEVFSK
jgi:hypothetical protein